MILGRDSCVSMRSGVASYGVLGHICPLLTFQQEIFAALNNLNVPILLGVAPYSHKFSLLFFL
jgi:hypothetical protein